MERSAWVLQHVLSQKPFSMSHVVYLSKGTRSCRSSPEQKEDEEEEKDKHGGVKCLVKTDGVNTCWCKSLVMQKRDDVNACWCTNLGVQKLVQVNNYLLVKNTSERKGGGVKTWWCNKLLM